MNDDEKYMSVCLDSAESALKKGEMPFGCVIVKNGNVVVTAENEVARTEDVTQHAEIVAMREAQRLFGNDLSFCTIYCSYEPCAMCALMIRELRFGKVVFGQKSPIEGGYTKFKILQDEELHRETPNHFGPVPEVMGGVLADQAEKLWELRSELSKGIER